MKIALFLIAVVLLLWLLRGSFGRRRDPGAASAPRREPQTIVACSQCGVHLPRDEALPGRGGVFCGEPHRVAYEKAHANDP
ncbi:MAG TPA: PP0621 family protein [Caldimonas sp.]|jgi:uncharacterized protein|nr:PP0621 family protein [Caldimonas sp.]HEX2540887.1 PP0621 family protein [Caldimonas sp.]